MPHLAAALLLTMAAAATASEVPGAVFIGGRATRPPGVDVASRPCVSMAALLHDGTAATTQACDEGGEAWPFLLRLPTTAPPPLAALVTAADGAGRTSRRVMLIEGTAATVVVDWQGAESGCRGAHTAAVIASSFAVTALLAVGLGLMVWGRARVEEAEPEHVTEGGGWTRARDGRLARGKG